MRTKFQQGVATAVLVVSIAALVLGAFSAWRWRAFALCQADLDARLIVAIDARTDAMDRLVVDVASAAKPGDIRAALGRYRETRAANPLPPSARDVCAR